MGVHSLRRGRRFALGEQSTSPFANHALVTAWLARVASNGGTAVPANTTLALNTFCNSLDFYGLTSLMCSVNPYASGTDLVTATTPIITPTGVNRWTPSGFVAADLTANGLRNSGSTGKYLDTGVAYKNLYSTYDDGGLTLYVAENPEDITCRDMGANRDGTTWTGSFILYPSNPPSAGAPGVLCGTDWDSAGIPTAGNYVQNSLWLGYVSMNRTTGWNWAFYRGKPSIGGHQLVVSGNKSCASVAGTDRSLVNCWVHCAHCNDYATYPSHKRFSFAAIHHGLSATQSANFYACIQRLRTDLGGGYVP